MPSQEALIVAPRLLAKRLHETDALPLDVAAWDDALLALPNATPGQRYRDIFTDCTQRVIERDGVIGLPLAALLEHFPVALLERIENQLVAQNGASESVFEYNESDK